MNIWTGGVCICTCWGNYEQWTPPQVINISVLVWHQIVSFISYQGKKDLSSFGHCWLWPSSKPGEAVEIFTIFELSWQSPPGLNCHHTCDQVYRKAVKKGFEFSLMVVGESGLGKSTLVMCHNFIWSWSSTSYPINIIMMSLDCWMVIFLDHHHWKANPGEFNVPDGHLQSWRRQRRRGRSNFVGIM